MLKSKSLQVIFWVLILIFSISLASCGKYLEGTGYVYSAETNQPLVGALVKVYVEHPSTDTFQMQTHTDSTGAFYARSDKVGCGFFCPDLYVTIIADNYQSKIVKNPNNDTIYLNK